jgi:hypothetical protein
VTAPAPVMVVMRHVYAAKGCAKGARIFLKGRGLDVRAFFLGGGLPVEDIEATGDAMALAVAKIAREEAARG